MKGWQKTSLIDFGDEIVSMFFYGGCNFRCPFCHNRDLVLNPDSLPDIAESDAFQYLSDKRKIYDGVVISGGEPTLDPRIAEICGMFKRSGFTIKLDTNGSRPEVLKSLVDAKLVDYVAMDIKTSLTKYPQAAPFIAAEDLVADVKQSVGFLINGKVDYEFRSTIYPPWFEAEDWEEIAEWLKGAKRYYLQQFNPKNTLDPEATKVIPHRKDYLEIRAEYLSGFMDLCEVRLI